jgi:hypothetical protein
MRSHAGVRAPCIASLDLLIQEAGSRRDDPRFAPLQALAMQASQAKEEYEGLMRTSLAAWALDVNRTLSSCVYHPETWELQTLCEQAFMLDRRLSASPESAKEMDDFFAGYCEVERGGWLEDHEEGLLAHVEFVWASINDLRDIPDLPLLLCLDYDEAKCRVARRVARSGRSAGGAVLAGHLVSLRKRIGGLIERVRSLVKAGAVVQSNCLSACTGRSLPRVLSPTEQAVWDILGGKERHLTGQEIADMCDKKYSGSFKDLLAGLVRDGLLRNVRGYGYTRVE